MGNEKEMLEAQTINNGIGSFPRLGVLLKCILPEHSCFPQSCMYMSFPLLFGYSRNMCESLGILTTHLYSSPRLYMKS